MKGDTAAGVNGLEAGQTLVVACAIIFHNLTMLSGAAGTDPAIRYAQTQPAECSQRGIARGIFRAFYGEGRSKCQTISSYHLSMLQKWNHLAPSPKFKYRTQESNRLWV